VAKLASSLELGRLGVGVLELFFSPTKRTSSGFCATSVGAERLLITLLLSSFLLLLRAVVLVAAAVALVLTLVMEGGAFLLTPTNRTCTFKVLKENELPSPLSKNTVTMHSDSRRDSTTPCRPFKPPSSPSSPNTSTSLPTSSIPLLLLPLLLPPRACPCPDDDDNGKADDSDADNDDDDDNDEDEDDDDNDDEEASLDAKTTKVTSNLKPHCVANTGLSASLNKQTRVEAKDEYVKLRLREWLRLME
jgi:hypothetical protein